MSLVLSRLLLLALVLPWLDPFAPGPSAAIVPWLFSAFCGVTAWACLLAHPLAPSKVLTQTAPQAWLLAALMSCAIALTQWGSWASAFVPWFNITSAGEAFGNLRQRNLFASLTSIGLSAALWYASSLKDATTSEAPQRRFVFLLPAVMLLALGNAVSASRSGFVEWFVLAGMTLWWHRKTWRSPVVKLALTGLGISLAGTWASPWLQMHFFGRQGLTALTRMGQDLGCSSRKVLYANVLQLIKQKPWRGWGWGELDYAHFINLYPGDAKARFCDILDNAHNLPLHLAVELGVPIAIVASLLVAWLVLRAKPWRDTQPTRQMAWCVLTIVALHSMVEYPLWYGPYQIATIISVALLCWVPRHQLPAHEDEIAPITPSHRAFWQHADNALVITVITAGLCYMAWDYNRVSQIYLTPESRDVAYRVDTFDKVKNSWLFEDQVHFAELSITPMDETNAPRINALAKSLLHFSPEAKVVEKLVDSAMLMNNLQEVRFYAARFKAAFPREYAKWEKDNHFDSESEKKKKKTALQWRIAPLGEVPLNGNKIP